MNVEEEIRRSIADQNRVIAERARHAVDRLYWMHAVGSGICGCGANVEGHSGWDNHGPVEMPMDKAWADTAADRCPHDDWSSRDIGGGWVRFTCHDCGETADRQETP